MKGLRARCLTSRTEDHRARLAHVVLAGARSRRSGAPKTVAAFTLIELLTALAVTAVIAALAFAVANGVLKSANRTTGALDAASRARLVLDLMETDIQGAMMRDDGAVWLAATLLDRADNSGLWLHSVREKPAGPENGSLVLDENSPQGPHFGVAGIWLRLFTTIRIANESPTSEFPEPSLAGLTAVGYQVIRRRPPSAGASAPPRYLLHRSVVRSTEIGGRNGALETGFDFNASGNGYVTPAATNDGTEIGDPYSVHTPHAAATVIASGVIDFGVRLYATNAEGDRELIFPISVTDTEHLARSWSRDAMRESRYPEAIEVFVRMLTEEGERLIEAYEAGGLGSRPARYASDAEWWWAIANAHAEIFVRRVAAPNLAP